MDLHAVVDGNTNKHVDILVYLYRTVCEDGGSRKEVQKEGCSKQEQQRGG